MLWVIDSLANETALTQNQQSVTQLLSSVPSTERAGGTILRIIGSMWMIPGTADANSQMHFAILQMASDAFAAAALPELQIDDAPYMHQDRLWIRSGDPSLNEAYVRKDFDIKAKRRIRSEDTVLAMIVENVSNAAVSITYNWALRTLLRV